jgi:hypothetical protein
MNNGSFKNIHQGINSFLGFFIYCPIWMKFGIRDLYVILLTMYELMKIEAGKAVLCMGA